MSLGTTLLALEEPLERAITLLIEEIISAPDPYEQIEKARRGLEMDALDAVADEAVDEALSAMKKV